MPGISTWLDIDPSRVPRSLGKADRAIDQTGRKLTGLQALGKTVFAGFSAAIVVTHLRAAARATGELIGQTALLADTQAAAERQVQSAIESTNNAAGTSLAALKDVASGLQEVTGAGDEFILGYQKVLLTFTNLGDEILPEVSEQVLNIAERMGTSAREAAVSLGAALNDPIAGLGRLSRSGIQFTESQKEQIKVLVESGQVLAAQRIILAELETQFGGAARAARDSLAGAIKAYRSEIGDAGEVLGRHFLPAQRDLIESMVDTAREAKGAADAIGENLAPEYEAAADNAIALAGALQLGFRVFEKAAELKVGRESLIEALSSTIQPVQFTRFLAVINEHLSEQEEFVSAVAKAHAEVAKQGKVHVEVLGKFSELVNSTAGPAKTLADRIKELEDPTKRWADELKKAQEEARKAVEQFHQLALAQQRLRELGPLETIDPNAPRSHTQSAARALGVDVRGTLNEITRDVAEAARQMGADQVAELKVVNREWAKDLKERMLDAGAFIAANWRDALSQVGFALFDALQSGDFSNIGSTLGQIGGAFAGQAAFLATGNPLIGMAAQAGVELVGSFVDSILSSTDRAKGTLRQAGEDVVAQIFQDEGGLGGVINDLAAGLNSFLDNLESALRGVIEIGGGGLGVVVDDEGMFTAFANNLEARFDNFNDTLDFLIVQAIRSASPAGGGSISGQSPEVLQALQNFAGNTARELEETVALALQLEAGRLGPEYAEISSQVRELVGRVVDAIRAGIDPQGAFADLSRLKDELIGRQRSEKEILEDRIAAFEAEIKIQLASIKAQEAETLASMAVTDARVQGARIFVDVADMTNRALGGVAGTLAGLGGLSVDVANRQAEALGLLREAAEQLEGLLFTDAERAEAFGNIGRGRGTSGAAAAAARERREALARELEMLRAVAAQDDERIRFLEREAQIAELISRGVKPEDVQEWLDLEAQIRANEEEAEAFNEALAEMARRLAEGRAAVQDAADFFGPGGTAGGIDDLIERAQDLINAIEASGIKVFGLIERVRDSLEEQIGGLVSGFLFGVTENELQRRIDGLAEGSRDRVALEEELADIQRRRQEAERLFSLLQIAEIELRLSAFPELAAEWSDEIARARELLSEPLPDFVEQIRDAGQAFREEVERVNVTGQQRGSLADLLDRIAQLQDPQGAGSVFEELRRMAEAIKPRLFVEAGTTLAEILEQIAGLEAAERAERFSPLRDLVAELTGGRPGSLSPLSALQQISQARSQIQAAVARGDADEAFRLAQQGVDLARGFSGAQARSFTEFLSGLDLTGQRSESPQRQAAMAARELVDLQRSQHAEREQHRAVQTQVEEKGLREIATEIRLVRAELAPRPAPVQQPMG